MPDVTQSNTASEFRFHDSGPIFERQSASSSGSDEGYFSVVDRTVPQPKSNQGSGKYTTKPSKQHSRVGGESTPKPELRYALNEHLRAAREEIRKMEDAARAGDQMDLAIAGAVFSSELRDLWRLRELRSDFWAMTLNALQGVIANKAFELFNVVQCESIREILEQHLRPDVDREDHIVATRLLRKVGLNPWRGLAQTSEQGNGNGDGSVS